MLESVEAIAINIAVVLFFVVLGGLFAGAEIALVSLRKSRIDQLSNQSKAGARLARLTSDPNRYLSAVQVGVTLAGFLSAGFGAAQISPYLADQLRLLGMGETLANSIAFVVVTILIAYVSLVLGELVPKRLALGSPEKIALVVAGPINAIATLSKPFIALLSVSTNGVLRLFGIRNDDRNDDLSRDELMMLVLTNKNVDDVGRKLIQEVLDLSTKTVKDIMVPRTRVAYMNVRDSISDALKISNEESYSRFPVVEGTIDEVVGVVHVRDLIRPGLSTADSLVRIIRPVLSLPASKVVLDALQEMREAGQHLAVIQDEYGGTAGIVTLEDLVEEIVGDIRDEYDDPQHAGVAPLGTGFLCEGRLSVRDAATDLGIELPKGPYETVAGFLVFRLGRLPEIGDAVHFDGWEFSVSLLEGRRVAQVHVRLLTQSGHAGDSSPRSVGHPAHR